MNDSQSIGAVLIVSVHIFCPCFSPDSPTELWRPGLQQEFHSPAWHTHTHTHQVVWLWWLAAHPHLPPTHIEIHQTQSCSLTPELKPVLCDSWQQTWLSTQSHLWPRYLGFLGHGTEHLKGLGDARDGQFWASVITLNNLCFPCLWPTYSTARSPEKNGIVMVFYISANHKYFKFACFIHIVLMFLKWCNIVDFFIWRWRGWWMAWHLGVTSADMQTTADHWSQTTKPPIF